MKIGIIGDGVALKRALLLLLAKTDHDIVIIDSHEDINPDKQDILICDDEEMKYICPVRIPELLQSCAVDLPYKDNTFRGGTRKKGGKIGYRRN